MTEQKANCPIGEVSIIHRMVAAAGTEADQCWFHWAGGFPQRPTCPLKCWCAYVAHALITSTVPRQTIVVYARKLTSLAERHSPPRTRLTVDKMSSSYMLLA